MAKADANPRIELYKALTKARNEIPSIGKDGDADTGKYRYEYVTLPKILDVITPILCANNLFLYHFEDEVEGVGYVLTRIVHAETGEYIETSKRLGDLRNIQDYGAYLTYCKRYGVGMLLALSLDKDGDGVDGHGDPIRDEPMGSALAENYVDKLVACKDHTAAEKIWERFKKEDSSEADYQSVKDCYQDVWKRLKTKATADDEARDKEQKREVKEARDPDVVIDEIQKELEGAKTYEDVDAITSKYADEVSDFTADSDRETYDEMVSGTEDRIRGEQST